MPEINLVKFDKWGYPSCQEHGAMTCVNREQSLWRCTVCHIGIDVLGMWAYKFLKVDREELERRKLKEDIVENKLVTKICCNTCDKFEETCMKNTDKDDIVCEEYSNELKRTVM